MADKGKWPRRQWLIVVASLAAAFAIIAFELVSDRALGGVEALAISALMFGGAAYGLMLMGLPQRTLTILHGAFWLLLIVGLPFDFPLSLLFGVIATLATAATFLLLPVGLIVTAIVTAILLMRRPSVRLMNMLIFSIGFVAFTAASIMLFMPYIAHGD